MYTILCFIVCLQKEREVKRQRKLLEQQLERMDSCSKVGSEGQSSSALMAIDDCKSFVYHKTTINLVYRT